MNIWKRAVPLLGLFLWAASLVTACGTSITPSPRSGGDIDLAVARNSIPLEGWTVDGYRLVGQVVSKQDDLALALHRFGFDAPYTIRIPDHGSLLLLATVESSSCPLSVADVATSTHSGVVSMRITIADGHGSCTADARPVNIVIPVGSDSIDQIDVSRPNSPAFGGPVQLLYI
jgi:hypothetical protein